MGYGSGSADLLLWGIETCSAIIPGYQIPMAAASICSPATALFGLSLPQPLPRYPPPHITSVPPSSHTDLKSQLPSVFLERVPRNVKDVPHSYWRAVGGSHIRPCLTCLPCWHGASVGPFPPKVPRGKQGASPSALGFLRGFLTCLCPRGFEPESGQDRGFAYILLLLIPQPQEGLSSSPRAGNGPCVNFIFPHSRAYSSTFCTSGHSASGS